jgi:hypothetical protein
MVRRFVRRWHAPAPVVRLADPAEMGTAYGLEASLEPIDTDEAPPTGKRQPVANNWLRPR